MIVHLVGFQPISLIFSYLYIITRCHVTIFYTCHVYFFHHYSTHILVLIRLRLTTALPTLLLPSAAAP
ncbi:hypothetical protein HanRHA438_Chr10g0445311 [Helianthus annuus]|nr:hypothetical protein HanRHA438_Chr10g0445311 [Helianthus annuus]